MKPWVFISCGAEATTPWLLRQLGVESFRHIPCLLNCDFNRGSTVRCIYFSTLIPRTRSGLKRSKCCIGEIKSSWKRCAPARPRLGV